MRVYFNVCQFLPRHLLSLPQPHPNPQSCQHFLFQVPARLCPSISVLELNIMQPGNILRIWPPNLTITERTASKSCARIRSQHANIFSLELNSLVLLESGNLGQNAAVVLCTLTCVELRGMKLNFSKKMYGRMHISHVHVVFPDCVLALSELSWRAPILIYRLPPLPPTSKTRGIYYKFRMFSTSVFPGPC